MGKEWIEKRTVVTTIMVLNIGIHTVYCTTFLTIYFEWPSI